MAEIQFKNQFPCELASNLGAADATIALKSGHGDYLPAIAQGEDKYFCATVVDKSGNREIVRVVQRVSGSDTLIVGSSISDQPLGSVTGRAQEGTAALAVLAADNHVIELRLTAAIMQGLSDLINAIAGASLHTAGRKLWFYEAAAPSGWVIMAAVGDRILAVSDGANQYNGSAGGAMSGAWTITGIAAANEAAHTHGVSGNSAAEASHTHGVSGNSAAEASHTHGVSGNSAAEASHTHPAGGLTVNTYHRHAIGATAGATLNFNAIMGGGDGGTSYYSDYVGASGSAVAGTSGAGSSHQHGVSITSGAGSSHQHGVSLTSAAGSSHLHGVSITSGAGSSHTHTVAHTPGWRPAAAVGIICQKS